MFYFLLIEKVLHAVIKLVNLFSVIHNLGNFNIFCIFPPPFFQQARKKYNLKLTLCWLNQGKKLLTRKEELKY